jgi:tRNA C32,U32 (ribose-2'-O)-methylase TrmJ
MLTNATYNLMETASVLSKGLYRYETFKKDSQSCQRCQQIWDQMRQADEDQLALLVSHLDEHLDQEQVTKRKAAA